MRQIDDTTSECTIDPDGCDGQHHRRRASLPGRWGATAGALCRALAVPRPGPGLSARLAQGGRAHAQLASGSSLQRADALWLRVRAEPRRWGRRRRPRRAAHVEPATSGGSHRRAGPRRPRVSQKRPARGWRAGIMGRRGPRVRGSSPAAAVAGGPTTGRCPGGLGPGIGGARPAAAPGESPPGPLARGGVDPVQCGRRGHRPAGGCLALAAPGRSAGTRLAPLAAGPAASQGPPGVDRLWGVCPTRDAPAGGGAGGGEPLDRRERLRGGHGRRGPGSV